MEIGNEKQANVTLERVLTDGGTFSTMTRELYRFLIYRDRSSVKDKTNVQSGATEWYFTNAKNRRTLWNPKENRREIPERFRWINWKYLCSNELCVKKRKKKKKIIIVFEDIAKYFINFPVSKVVSYATIQSLIFSSGASKLLRIPSGRKNYLSLNTNGKICNEFDIFLRYSLIWKQFHWNKLFIIFFNSWVHRLFALIASLKKRRNLSVPTKIINHWIIFHLHRVNPNRFEHPAGSQKCEQIFLKIMKN